MLARSIPPFRADHVGSLLRSPELLAARERYAREESSAAELRQAEDRSIRDAVRLQEEVGFQAATDGEHRRTFVAGCRHGSTVRRATSTSLRPAWK
jgi:5-methyltetrahydropteroyltriglutamate--homocysteine methyltransferase